MLFCPQILRDGDIAVGCSPSSALIFLPHLEAVLQHRQAAVQEVATQCGVSQNVAAFLLDQYQGNAKAACTAWDSSPCGNHVNWLCLCLQVVASHHAHPPTPPLLCTPGTECKLHVELRSNCRERQQNPTPSPPPLPLCFCPSCSMRLTVHLLCITAVTVAHLKWLE